MNVGHKISLKIPVAPPQDSESTALSHVRKGSGLRIPAGHTPRLEEKHGTDDEYLDLLAPIVMVLAKSNPRGLRSLASLVDDGACDSPSAQMGAEGLHPTPPPLTTALLVRGIDSTVARRESKVTEPPAPDDSSPHHSETRSHLIQQFSVALKQFFSACQPIVSVRWQGSIWKEGLAGTEIMRSFSARHGTAAVLSLMTVLSSHDDVLGYGSTVLFMITMLLAPPGGAEPAPRPPPRQADKRASARPDWVTDCLRDIVDGGALEVLLAIVVGVDCIAVQVTSLSTIALFLRLSPVLLRRFFKPCCTVSSAGGKGCDSEDSVFVSGLSVILGVIDENRDKYALQAAAADVLRAAAEAGGSSCSRSIARAPYAYRRGGRPASALPNSTARQQFLVERLVRSRPWNGARVLLKALRRCNVMAGISRATHEAESVRSPISVAPGSGASSPVKLPRLRSMSPPPAALSEPAMAASPTLPSTSILHTHLPSGRALQGAVSLSGRQRRQMMQAHASIFSALLALVIRCPTIRALLATGAVLDLLEPVQDYLTANDPQLKDQAHEALQLLLLARKDGKSPLPLQRRRSSSSPMSSPSSSRARVARVASSRLPCPLADLSDDSDDDMASSSSRSAGITSSPPLGGRRVRGTTALARRSLQAAEPTLTPRGLGGLSGLRGRAGLPSRSVVDRPTGGQLGPSMMEERAIRAWVARTGDMSRRRSVRSAHHHEGNRLPIASTLSMRLLQRSVSAPDLLGLKCSSVFLAEDS